MFLNPVNIPTLRDNFTHWDPNYRPKIHNKKVSQGQDLFKNIEIRHERQGVK